MPLLYPFSFPEATCQNKRLQPRNQHKTLNKDQWNKHSANLLLKPHILYMGLRFFVPKGQDLGAFSAGLFLGFYFADFGKWYICIIGFRSTGTLLKHSESTSAQINRMTFLIPFVNLFPAIKGQYLFYVEWPPQILYRVYAFLASIWSLKRAVAQALQFPSDFWQHSQNADFYWCQQWDPSAFFIQWY